MRATGMQPGMLTVFILIGAFFYLALTAWGATTVVGLFQLRRWARYSILIIGGCFAALSFFFFLLAVVIGMMSQFSGQPSMPQNAVAMARILYAFLGMVSLLVGVWWLVYFNLGGTRDAFNPHLVPVFDPALGYAVMPPAEPVNPRPLFVSIIAVLCLLGGIGCFALLAMPFPALFFGMVFIGIKAKLLYISCGIITVLIGIGLWKLKERARLAFIVLYSLWIFQLLVTMFRPGAIDRYQQAVNDRLLPGLPISPMPMQHALTMIGYFFSIIVMAVLIALMVYYRGAFQKKAAELPLVS